MKSSITKAPIDLHTGMKRFGSFLHIEFHPQKWPLQMDTLLIKCLRICFKFGIAKAESISKGRVRQFFNFDLVLQTFEI